ncbi:competence type IV pilus major pilin ComGC [Robertmurraya massiliosenegalensis]|uniref:competence type IV pilus major pilin ComGC n=1 Tax=Robertmurraya massiliosenegalensis TaxID=1287657 RepID=UPI0002F17826|nr:competence type IV pilus major pilin ComGC [Robertmurraya massiliosenegalensis]
MLKKLKGQSTFTLSKKNDRKYARLAVKKINEQNAFTLIEMMIVLLVISVLLIITIPNITTHNSTINTKGCDALKKMVEAQVQAYKMDNNTEPISIVNLQSKGYLTAEQSSCPNGDKITIDSEGKVDSGT